MIDAREAEGREAAPTAIVVDSQSVMTTQASRPRGFDAGKRVKDRDAPAPLLKAVKSQSPKSQIPWVVERTLGGIDPARRLSEDFEATIESALAWLPVAGQSRHPAPALAAQQMSHYPGTNIFRQLLIS